jgi:hypothetical protein
VERPAGKVSLVISSRSLISALARGRGMSWTVPGAWEKPGRLVMSGHIRSEQMGGQPGTHHDRRGTRRRITDRPLNHRFGWDIFFLAFPSSLPFPRRSP